MCDHFLTLTQVPVHTYRDANSSRIRLREYSG